MLKQKLRSAKGETLTELLAAILICGFSIMLLLGMIINAMRINQSARELDMGADGNGGFYGALSDVETGKGDIVECKVILSQAGSADDITIEKVNSYTKDGLTAYAKEVGP